ncbi:uncharacterized protein PHACADRAFT_249838 [Phanerochaete carnosa HHB-10118-sp]|uniref:Uncharacterized protein n=1 Tax=Phanerochaete carnosa (strain HHB-10118-sp) TaxID=650164 RepID=K5X947_PHACS|nr:uncharacterized protein PHACADRAFT_249838 [Phanerochaete carnosa HHB-10118-sp]EKM59387.1 hypothetical protein PHACADRAFT_249838 [Phanerochaete carnosa HHB-10118-sp]
MKNAEVQTFNGCGFCKWARTNPLPKSSGYANAGWPGCCRPPLSHEQRLIPAADWPAVSRVHHVPIPPDVKALLESLTNPQRGGPFVPGNRSSPPSQPSSLSRRSGGGAALAGRTDNNPAQNAVVATPRNRSRGSPQQSVASLSSSTSRNSGSDDGTPPPSAPPATEQKNSPRRPSIEMQLEKRRDTSREARHSPGRKSIELSSSLSRKGSNPKASVSATVSSTAVRQKIARPSLDSVTADPDSNFVDTNPEHSQQDTSSAADRRRRPSLNDAFAGMNVSGDSYASSSDSGGSETTVTSDGGFTDYLSDESEAELQRQAELKAAMIAQTHMEEQEFRAARQQLASIDLRPPKSWTRT